VTRRLATLIGAALLLLFFGPTVATRIAVQMFSGTLDAVVDEPSAEGIRLHGTLHVADLHSDALLWDRSLLRRGSVGHVDVPRLIEGRVAVQMFTTVTKTPAGMNIESNSGSSDWITLLAVLQGWPPRAWTSLVERTLHQARKLRTAAERSGGRLTIVTSRQGLEEFLRRRDQDAALVAGVLGIEGAHALEADLANLDRVYRSGVRMIGLTHFFDNEVGGSAHGTSGGGLTAFGRQVVERMEALGIAVDLAHASPALIDDVLAMASTPLIVSHTGVKATCDNQRNLDDGRLVRIAETGGMIGIGLWPTAVCGERPEDWARAVRAAVELAGVEHVGLGSDWDGAVDAIVDAANTVHLTQALLDEGFSHGEIRMIMGGNAIRVLRQTLPDGTPDR
jgi:membrane dipeptidase